MLRAVVAQILPGGEPATGQHQHDDHREPDPRRGVARPRRGTGPGGPGGRVVLAGRLCGRLYGRLGPRPLPAVVAGPSRRGPRPRRGLVAARLLRATARGPLGRGPRPRRRDEARPLRVGGGGHRRRLRGNRWRRGDRWWSDRWWGDR